MMFFYYSKIYKSTHKLAHKLQLIFLQHSQYLHKSALCRRLSFALDFLPETRLRVGSLRGHAVNSTWKLAVNTLGDNNSSISSNGNDNDNKLTDACKFLFRLERGELISFTQNSLASLTLLFGCGGYQRSKCETATTTDHLLCVL